MTTRSILFLTLFALASWAKDSTVQIVTTSGQTMEGVTSLASIRLAGRAIPLASILSIHMATPATAAEAKRIEDGIVAISGKDRAARDRAVEDLTALGLPVLTPLLKVYKDTDQHEPRPLYRLFERIIPSTADGFDRTLSLVRLANGDTVRGKVEAFDVELKGGSAASVKFADIRRLAVRQRSVARRVDAHSIRHSTQIEYLDSGVALSRESQVDVSARGFTRLSWETDSWASDPDGLKVPGSPAYKSNLWDGQPFGALVGRVGAAGPVFFVGSKLSKSGLGEGRLYLAINDNGHWQNNLGQYRIALTATNAYDLGDAQ